MIAPKRKRLLLLAVALGLFAALSVPKAMQIWQDGLSFGACQTGFGPVHRSNRIMVLNRLFLRPLPDDVEITRFECSGFQDIEIKADFALTPEAGRDFLAMLTEMHDGPMVNIYVGQRDKRHDTVEGAGGREDRFVLPPSSFLHTMNVTVKQPIDPTSPWRMELVGGQF